MPRDQTYGENKYRLSLSPERRFELIIQLAAGLAAGGETESVNCAISLIEKYLKARGRFLANKDGLVNLTSDWDGWRPREWK